jgi:hypothetical protein
VKSGCKRPCKPPALGCGDPSRFAAGLTPHQSVGPAGSPEEARRLLAEWRRAREPTRFDPSAVALRRRGPETPFEVERLIPLAADRA